MIRAFCLHLLGPLPYGRTTLLKVYDYYSSFWDVQKFLGSLRYFCRSSLKSLHLMYFDLYTIMIPIFSNSQIWASIVYPDQIASEGGEPDYSLHCLSFSLQALLWWQNLIVQNRATTCQKQQNECAPSEDTVQSGHPPPRLIWVFAVSMKKPWVLSYPLSAQRRLWSDWEDAQADLSSLGAHSFCWFCHVVAHFKIIIAIVQVPKFFGCLLWIWQILIWHS